MISISKKEKNLVSRKKFYTKEIEILEKRLWETWLNFYKEKSKWWEKSLYKLLIRILISSFQSTYTYTIYYSYRDITR